MENDIPKILVVGSINMDLVLETDRIPESGESIIGKRYQYVPGGKGSNQAAASARLGAFTTFVGKVGSDNYGRRLRKSLSKEGVNINYLKKSEEKKTGLAVILLENQGQNRILVYPGANEDIKKNELIKVFDSSYQAMIIQLEIEKEIVTAACRIAQEHNIPVIMDTGPAKKFILDEVEKVEILTPNETEASFLTEFKVKDIESAREAAKILFCKVETEYVVIKLGKKGALLYAEDYCKHFPAQKIDRVVDTTAAGDAFTAAMTYKYIKDKDIKKAVEFGNQAGALTVTKKGAQPSLPHLDDIINFFGDE